MTTNNTICKSCLYKELFTQVRYSYPETYHPAEYVVITSGGDNNLSDVLFNQLDKVGISRSQLYEAKSCDCVWTSDGKETDALRLQVINSLEISLNFEQVSHTVSYDKYKNLMISQCKRKVFEQIEAIKPKAILVSGNQAFQYFSDCPYNTIEQANSEFYLKEFSFGSIPIVFCLSPHAVVKGNDQNAKTKFEDAIKVFKYITSITKDQILNKDVQVKVIDTFQSLSDFCFDVKSGQIERELWCIDIETTSKKWKEAKTTCIGIGVNDNTSYVIDLYETDLVNERNIVRSKELLGELLGNNVPKILHNGMYDYLVLKREGVTLNNYCYDTLYMERRINETILVSKELNAMIKRYGVMCVYDQELHQYVQGKIELSPDMVVIPFCDSFVPKSVLFKYLGCDVVAPRRLFPKLKDIMIKDGTWDGYIQQNLTPTIYCEMSLRGIKIDDKLAYQMIEESKELENKTIEDLAKYYLEFVSDNLDKIMEENRLDNYIADKFINNTVINHFNILNAHYPDNKELKKICDGLVNNDIRIFDLRDACIDLVEFLKQEYKNLDGSNNNHKKILKSIEYVIKYKDRVCKDIESKNRKRDVPIAERCLLQLNGATKALALGSTKQMLELFHSMNIHCPKHLCTEKGNESLDDNVLSYLLKKQDKNSIQYKCLNELHKFRKINKLRTTYLLNDEESKGMITCFDQVTKRVHSTFVYNGAETGRPTSHNPNILNIPRPTNLKDAFPDRYQDFDIRRLFIPEDGHKFVFLDYSQAEIWILGMDARRAYYHVKSMNPIPELFKPFMDEEWGKALFDFYQHGQSYDLKLFNSEGVDTERYHIDEQSQLVFWTDVHSWVASLVFNKYPWEVSKEERTKAKIIIFGLNYGKTVKGFAQDLLITEREAQELCDSILKGLGNVGIYHKYIDFMIDNYKYIQNVYGRKRHFPSVVTNNDRREGYNFTPQSTVNDKITEAIIEIYKMIKDLDLKSHIVNNVYDEITIECPDDEIELGIPLEFKKIMEKPLPIYNASLRADLEIKSRWSSKQ